MRSIGTKRAAVAAAGVLLAACSVSTPRDGFTAAGRQTSFDDGPGTVVDGSGRQLTGDETTLGSPQADSDGVATGDGGGGSAISGDAGGGGTGAGTGGGSTSGGGAPGGAAGADQQRRASDVGVTADAITVGFSYGRSSATGVLEEGWFNNGFMTWVNDVNERGGINGRRVNVKTVDNGGTTEGGIAACKNVANSGIFVAFVSAANDSEPSCIDKAGVPAVVQFAQGVDVPWSVVRALQATPPAGKSLAHFVQKGLDAGGKKVGVIFLNDPTFKAAADRFKATAQELRIAVVASQSVEENQGSFVSELTRMRESGAEIVVAIVALEIVGILRDARAINYRPTWTGVAWTLDEASQAAPELFRGIKGLRFAATVDSPGFAEFEKVAARHGVSQPTSTDAYYYGQGRIIGHYLSKSGVNPTRDAWVKALDSGDVHDNGLTAPVSWTPGHTLGSRSWFPAECCDSLGRWRSLGPASETDF